LSSVNRPSAFLIAGTGVFLLSAILIFFLTADLFHPSLDEGIYLEGGHRVLLGQVPYRDFFAYTGPLIYWVQAVLEWIFGPDLRMLRLSTALGVGLTCFGTFWMAERFVGWKTGIVVALVFLGMRMPSFPHFTVNHRWLSTSLLTLAIAAALDATRFRATRFRAKWLLLAAGALSAGAAWATPTYLIPLSVLIVWTAFREPRRGLTFLTGGVLLISLPAALWLGLHGALLPMLDKLVWASRQYSVANRVPFGYYPFGFGGTHQAIGAVTVAIAWIKDVRLEIPVVLIPLALILGAIEVIRGRWKGPAALLLWLAGAMVLTTWPRWDVNLLIGVTPPCYVLLTIWGEERLGSLASRPIKVFVLAGYAIAAALAFVYAADLFSTVNSFSYFPTRLGLLRNIPEDGDAWASLEQRIPEGESVFVFPYLPSIGYMLKARNPTSYSYLQPGMMSRADEAVVLGELKANPPKFILRQLFPDRQILVVWPNSDRSLMRFPSIDGFIATRYSEIETVMSPHFQVTILERK
jgi:4-amino-4-deoxy-L-arabinose transferase-like glycosyltransferase